MNATRPIVVLDPGHGGQSDIAGSTPDHIYGPAVSEKALTLELARQVREQLGSTATVLLTRTSDTNLSLTSRAAFAQMASADYFISLHFNGHPDPRHDTTEVYVSRQSTDGDRELAAELLRSVTSSLGTASGGVLAADLGVVVRSRHAPQTKVALVEVCDLTNSSRAQAARQPGFLDQIGAAISDALRKRLAADSQPSPVASLSGSVPADLDPVTRILDRAEARLRAETVRQFSDVQTAADQAEGDAKSDLDRLEREFADAYPGLISRLESEPGMPTAFALWNFGVDESDMKRFEIALTDFGSVFTNLRDRGFSVDIVGSASVSGSAEQNMELSFARALAVANVYERRFNMPEARMNVRQVGSRMSPPPPDVFIHFADDEATWRAWNRRVEVHPVAGSPWTDASFDGIIRQLETRPDTLERQRAIKLAQLLKDNHVDDLFVMSFQALLDSIRTWWDKDPLYNQWLLDPSQWDRFSFAAHVREELAKLSPPDSADDLLAEHLVSMIRGMNQTWADLRRYIVLQEEGGSGAAIQAVFQKANSWIGDQIASDESVYSVLRPE